jgi:hypothetical protein
MARVLTTHSSMHDIEVYAAAYAGAIEPNRKDHVTVECGGTCIWSLEEEEVVVVSSCTRLSVHVVCIGIQFATRVGAG